MLKLVVTVDVGQFRGREWMENVKGVRMSLSLNVMDSCLT